MNSQSLLRRVQLPLSLGLAVLFPGLVAPQTPQADAPRVPSQRPARPTNDEFAAVSHSVIALLQSSDAARFAREITPSAEDWRAIAATNLPEIAENLKGFADSADQQRQEAEAAAKAFLATADSLHLDFSKGDLQARVVNPRFLGGVHFPTLQSEGQRLPHAQEVEIILNPDAGTNISAKGEFKILLRNLNKFPNGWRGGPRWGIQWESFPSNVADGKTLREIAILDKAARRRGIITDKDDPALLRLGQVLVRFIRERDTAIYAKEALVNSDLVWALMQKSGDKGTSRQELEKETNRETQEQTEIARSMLGQSEAAGIDLKNAEIEIREAAVGRLEPGLHGSLEGLTGELFQLKLAVKSDGKSRTGTSLSGDYILAVNGVMRFRDDWKAKSDVHWYGVPAGVLDARAAAAMQLENYVAEHESLPPGSPAPEIEFTTLKGEKKMKLSDLRGKVVVLDFWATWCAPCQKPMADLQKLRQAHSDWGDNVAIVPLSIDDTLDIMRQHVNKRDWTNTFNVWAGDGGYQSAPAKAFRIHGVPITYIIDAQGNIVVAGHPAGTAIERKSGCHA